MYKKINRIALLFCLFALGGILFAAGEKEADGTGSGKESVTLEYWCKLGSTHAKVVQNMSETVFTQELLERTGINIEYVHPAAGQEREIFNLMIASNDLPDIMEYTWLKFPGGPTSAIENGYIIKLNETFEKHSPNISAALKKYPHIDKMIKTDEGYYYGYPSVRGDEKSGNILLNYSGCVVRQDWLDDLGMELPETIEEWETMLRAFRDQKGAKFPLSTPYYRLHQMFAPAYDSSFDHFVDNGVVKFGGTVPGRIEYLKKMNEWFSEGLLDNNYAVIDEKTCDSYIMNGKAGAIFDSGGGMGTMLKAMQDKDPSFNLSATVYPYTEKGKHIKIINTSAYSARDYSAAISSQCKDVETAARFLDYGYSEDGRMFMNFGEQGLAHTMVNGEPKYTELILNNPDGLSVAAALGMYTRANTGGMCIQDSRYLLQYYSTDQQRNAVKLWSVNDSDGEVSLMPPISLTPEESEEFARLFSDIKPFYKEMEAKFIMGEKPFSEYDDYVKKMNEMGLDTCTEIYQRAYDRYMQR
jgi:putative aldouronate transport system substrate-binding protein